MSKFTRLLLLGLAVVPLGACLDEDGIPWLPYDPPTSPAPDYIFEWGNFHAPIWETAPPPVP